MLLLAQLCLALPLSVLAAAPARAAYYPRQESTPTSTPTATSSASNGSFPTDVGFAGPIKYGVAPFLVEINRLNGSQGNSPIETRWNATDDDTFDIFTSVGNEVSVGVAYTALVAC